MIDPNKRPEDQPDDSAYEETSDFPPTPAGDEVALYESITRERDDYHNQLRRCMADYANFQKRSRAQADLERQYAAGPLALDLLQVIDNFERALEAARASGSESIVNGLEMIHKQLLEALAKHGVEPIEALDQPFDPAYHEALMQQSAPDRPEGTVMAVLGKGYRIRDRVLRPAKVAVSTA